MWSAQLCHPRNAVLLAQRFKTAKFKPKVARTRPLKTPSALALDHFDFYYGPMFGKRWPSIRLGLLSPHKYIAVTNTLSQSWETHEEILKELGTVNLLDKIRGKTAEEAVEQKKQQIEERAREETREAMEQDSLSSAQSSAEAAEAQALQQREEDAYSRSEAGLEEFRGPEGTLSMSELQLRKRDVDELEFDVSGLEGEGVEIVRREHFIYYPKGLRVHAFERGVTADYPPPVKDHKGVPSWWLLDGGSLVPVLALGLEKGDSLLDVCAAPGGKSLLALLTGLPDKVVCNDAKMARLGQLKRALSTYIPADSQLADRVVLKRKDAGNIANWDELNCYDKVIADVPCSTDRLSVQQDEGNIFSPASTQMRLGLPQLQTKILINSLRSVKVGGSVVYSTCSLSPAQNEAVVENAVAIAAHKFGIQVVEESLSGLTTHLTSSGLFRFSDQCRLGALVLPFLPANFGPMYVCKLHRLK